MLSIIPHLFAVVIAVLLASCQAPLPYNQIQVIGSHNSYKKAIDPELLNEVKAFNAELAASLDYSHLPLEAQLDLGLRNLELDILNDPTGGRYANPYGLGVAHATRYDAEIMQQPGFKVMHIQDIDFRSQCPLLIQCLDTIAAWSNRHPRHVPIVVTINAKYDQMNRVGFTDALPFDQAAWSALDETLRSHLKVHLFTPDELRGDAASLPAALADGWPSLKSLRGRVIVVLDHQGEKLKDYIDGHLALAGRAMFVNAPEGTPESAIRIVNDPIKDFALIQQLVKTGYLVRTRADADTLEARSGDTNRRDQAFQSGAQIITTDYYLPDERFKTGYRVEFPNGKMVRCDTLLVARCVVPE